MAFEAFVAAGKASRDRTFGVGVVVSVSLHVPPLILFALRLVASPQLVDHTDSLPASRPSLVVPVRIASLRYPPPPTRDLALTGIGATSDATPAPAANKGRSHKPAPAQAALQPRRVEIPPDGAVAVKEHPAEHPTIESDTLAKAHVLESPSAAMERQAATVGNQILAGLSADTGLPVPSGLRSAPAVAHPSVGGQLTSGAAAYLRTYETFPSLPASSWSWRNRRSYVFSMQVCVADNGSVDDVVIQRGARPDLDVFLATAIRTWRYRPWIVSGSPRPFCHPLRITYSRG